MTIHHSFPSNGMGNNAELGTQPPAEKPEPEFVTRAEVVGGVAVTAYDQAGSKMSEVPLDVRSSTANLLRYL